MTIYIWKGLSLKMDNAAGTLTDISTSVNQASLQAAITMLETTGLNVAAPTKVNGLSNVSIPLNGFLNSTTEPIFRPLLSGTSVTKSVQYGVATSRFYYGEFLPSNVQFSGSPDTLQMWSATMELTGALTSTSTTQA